MERYLPTSAWGWHHDIEILRDAERQEGDYEFVAKLPPVVGNVPESEQDTFDQAHPPSVSPDQEDFVRLRLDEDDTAYLRRLLPRTFRIIDQDCNYIGAMEARIALSAIELRRQFVRAGNAPHFHGLHIDLPAQRPPSFALPIYLISNRQTTLFYDGPAILHPTAQSLGLRSNHLIHSRQLVPAPPYGIVRASFASVHTAPLFSESTTRTFVRIFTQPERATL